MQFLLISLRTNVIFLHKNKLDIVQRVQLLTGQRPMRSFSLAAVATIALWKSEPMLVLAKRDVQLMTRLLDNIQQFMHGLIVIKTLLFYLD